MGNLQAIAGSRHNLTNHVLGWHPRRLVHRRSTHRGHKGRIYRGTREGGEIVLNLRWVRMDVLPCSFGLDYPIDRIRIRSGRVEVRNASRRWRTIARVMNVGVRVRRNRCSVSAKGTLHPGEPGEVLATGADAAGTGRCRVGWAQGVLGKSRSQRSVTYISTQRQGPVPCRRRQRKDRSTNAVRGLERLLLPSLPCARHQGCPRRHSHSRFEDVHGLRMGGGHGNERLASAEHGRTGKFSPSATR